jgi:hypothetical protein
MHKLKKLIFFWFLTLSYSLCAEPVFNQLPIHEAFVTSNHENYNPKIITTSPPQDKNESIPQKPFNEAIWIKGYWSWIEEINQFLWVCGVWRKPPLNYQWIEGSWVKNGSGWSWQEGFWSEKPRNSITYINQTPPYSITDAATSKPQDNYFYIPGYWSYSNGSYNWLKGTWSSLNPNWILTPAKYVWRSEGFVFCPLFWDYPLDERGIAYSCQNDNQNYTIITSENVIERLFIYYPNYITLYSHWWFINPGFWQDCWCLPPWWYWGNWWSFGWADLWGLWWWWGVDGAWPAFWIDIEIALIIEAALDEMFAFMAQISRPDFPIVFNSELIRPQGSYRTKEPIRPNIITNITPIGSVTPPLLPTTTPQVTPEVPKTVVPPPPPPAPPPSYTPPTYTPPTNPPSNPPTYTPPTYTPPTNPPRNPPTYTPPTYTPPTNPPSNPPTYTPPTYTPPTNPSNNPPTYTPPRGNDQKGKGPSTIPPNSLNPPKIDIKPESIPKTPPKVNLGPSKTYPKSDNKGQSSNTNKKDSNSSSRN